MKSILLAGLALSLAGFITTGCGSLPKRFQKDIQAVLDAELHPQFTGPAHFNLTGPLVDATVDAEGLKRLDNRWTWTYLGYTLNYHVPPYSSVVSGYYGAKGVVQPEAPKPP